MQATEIMDPNLNNRRDCVSRMIGYGLESCQSRYEYRKRLLDKMVAANMPAQIVRNQRRLVSEVSEALTALQNI